MAAPLVASSQGAPAAGSVPASPRTGAAAVPTLGVEEEFVLLDPDGNAACVAPDVLAVLSADPRVKPEFMRFQLETNTGVCADLETLAADLIRERRRAARVAALVGTRLVAVATPPFDVPRIAAVTDKSRYRELAARFDESTATDVSCGCHVHVAVPSRDLGVGVLNRIRSWLPVLLALSGNSPLWHGHASGWESYRYLVQRESATATIPPARVDASAYDDAVDALIARGAALDPSSIYYFARLSPRYPTVEIRITDTCLTVADAVLVAGVCRGLVMTALADIAADRPYLHLDDTVLAAAAMAAARAGLDALLVHPLTGGPASGHDVLDALVREIGPALEAAGDRRLVTALLRCRLRRGSGSTVQRVLAERLGREGFVLALARATADDLLPPGPGRTSPPTLDDEKRLHQA